MKILIAPDSYKGTLSSPEVCRIIKDGISKVLPNAVFSFCPLADGGEGTSFALTSALGGEIITVNTHDPLMRPITAQYGLCGDTAVIETAAASGITLLKENELNPKKATTYGTGELIKDALNRGAEKIVLGIGGSATNDGGSGCLKALGALLFDEKGEELADGGEALLQLHKIDLTHFDRRIKDVKIFAACDVTSPLCGEKGASFVFAPQKGADSETVLLLENALMHYGKVATETLGKDFTKESGAGAAGGLGFCLKAFMNAALISGFTLVADTLKLKEKAAECDLVITGEGKTDRSSLLGKLPIQVAELAKEVKKPCMILSGDFSCTEEELKNHFTYYKKARKENEELSHALENAEQNLLECAEQAAREFLQ